MVNQTRLSARAFGPRAVPTASLEAKFHLGGAPGRPGASRRWGLDRLQAHQSVPPITAAPAPRSAASRTSPFANRGGPAALRPLDRLISISLPTKRGVRGLARTGPGRLAEEIGLAVSGLALAHDAKPSALEAVGDLADLGLVHVDGVDGGELAVGVLAAED